MKYKLAAADLDGTLLNSDNSISQRNMEAINELKRRGCIFTIITGRMYSAAKPLADELKLTAFMGVYQGAVVLNAESGEVLRRITLDVNVCKNIFEDAMSRGLNVQAYINDRVYVQKYDEYTQYYEKLNNIKVDIAENLEDMIASDDSVKLLINSSEEATALNYGYFFDKYSELASVVLSGKHFIEFTDKKADKGNALKFIAEKYGIQRDEIIAFGDQLNDVSMLNYAGMGVAMGNSPECVKNRADHVTLSNEESGVAYAIERLCL